MSVALLRCRHLVCSLPGSQGAIRFMLRCNGDIVRPGVIGLFGLHLRGVADRLQKLRSLLHAEEDRAGLLKSRCH